MKRQMLSEESLINKLIANLEGKKKAFDKEAATLLKKLSLTTLPKDFDPSSEFAHQLIAIENTVQIIGTAVEVANEGMPEIIDILKELDASQEDFLVQANQALSKANTLSANVTAYLVHEGFEEISSPIADIGKKIKPGETVSDTMISVATALSEVSNLNLRREVEKILKSKEAELGGTIDEFDRQSYESDMKAAEGISEVAAKFTAIAEKLKEVEEIINNQGSDAAQSVSSKVFERKIRSLVRLVLKEEINGSR